jgi:hypothetical protein
MNAMTGVVGKVAELRINPKIEGELSLTQKRDADAYIKAFNGRGGGSFKMCIGPTRGYVQENLRIELSQHISTGWASQLAPFFQFRINYNDIDSAGLTWEGFGIAEFNWLPVSEN